MWNLIVWIVIGALAGWIASKIMKTDAQQGGLANVIVGVVGALIGGFVVRLFGGEGAITGINPMSFLIALLGSVILLFIIKKIKKV